MAFNGGLFCALGALSSFTTIWDKQMNKHRRNHSDYTFSCIWQLYVNTKSHQAQELQHGHTHKNIAIHYVYILYACSYSGMTCTSRMPFTSWTVTNRTWHLVEIDVVFWETCLCSMFIVSLYRLRNFVLFAQSLCIFFVTSYDLHKVSNVRLCASITYRETSHW
jgi:hypothetical protein